LFLFDLFVVLFGTFSTWILEPVLYAASAGNPFGYQMTVVRSLRLMRLVRVLRLSQQFKELWNICRGMAQAARAALAAVLLVIISIYVFACVAIEIITRSDRLATDPVTSEIVQAYFGSLPLAMMTLMQFATADAVAGVYYPLVQQEPVLAVYFLLVWMTVTVLIMNLVTAVIVESAIEHASEDVQAAQQALRRQLKIFVPQIEAVFDRLDVDGTGQLTLDDMDFSVMELPDTLQSVLQEDRMIDLFSHLIDGSPGYVNKVEFVQVISTLALSDVPFETTQMLYLLRHIQGRMLHLETGADVH
jgi:hypothetical protein